MIFYTLTIVLINLVLILSSRSIKITGFLDKRSPVDPLHQGFSEEVDMVHSGGSSTAGNGV